jgi:hypothetical protein
MYGSQVLYRMLQLDNDKDEGEKAVKDDKYNDADDDGDDDQRVRGTEYTYL